MAFPVAALVLIGITTVFAAIPSYIHVCKRNDPNLDACILNSVENLRPKLKEGIPALEIPPLEPLQLGDLVVQHGGRLLKFYGKDFVVRGASNFELVDLISDLPNNSFQVKIRFPKLTIESNYEVSGKFLNLNLHGKGPVTVEAEDIDGNAILKGKLTEKDGQNYIVIDTMDLKLNLKNYEVKLSKGFFKDQAITDAVNAAIHENKRDIINLMRPRVESVVKDVLLDTANKITKHFTYDELFPLN